LCEHSTTMADIDELGEAVGRLRSGHGVYASKGGAERRGGEGERG
jgi:hypothetical protein